VKLLFADSQFALVAVESAEDWARFSSAALDDTDEDYAPDTRPTERAPATESPALVGLRDYASEVRVRAAARAKVVRERRGA